MPFSRTYRKIRILPILLFLLFIHSGCKNQPEKITVKLKDVRTADSAQMEKKLKSGSSMGYILYDPARKEVVSSFNRNLTFIPASVTKLVTTTAAISILGADYRFKTRLDYSGKIIDGKISGDLILRGGGDPLLKIAHLMAMTEKMVNLGIKEITGKFIYDDSLLVHSRMIDSGMHEDAPYNTGFSSLSLWFNINFFRWETEKVRKKNILNFYLVPDLPMYSTGTFESKDKKNNRLKFSGTPERGSWLIPAHITEKKPSGSRRIPVKDPSLYTALMFQKLCKLYGIILPHPEKGRLPENNNNLYTHESLSLENLSEVVLSYSNNMMAELLNITAAGKITGKQEGLRESGSIISDYLKKRIYGINWKGFVLANGSGLTSSNRISPEQMLGVLLLADTLKFEKRNYMAMLPISGWSGSLQNRLDKPVTAFMIWAKTGAISYSASLAGYLFTKSSRKLIFAVFISDFNKRDALDREEDSAGKKRADSGSYSWSKYSSGLIDTLVSGWIEKY